jgi:AraC family transcriptional regulator
MKERIEDVQRSITESIQSLFNKQELLAKVVEFFPYPIQIFSPDGTARMINKAALEMIGIRSVESHVGKYNVFEDPIVQKLGTVDQIKQVLKGRTVYLTDFNAPYQELMRHYNLLDRDIQTISADITCFPLENDGVIEYFAAVFIFKKIYRGKEEIEWSRQYIEAHWKEPYNAEKTAKAACLSKAHFSKLFKKHIGVTPHEYYLNYKISKLKEMLRDTNLSVSQAFSACNMDYNGHSARVFKEKTGISPSDYRKTWNKNIK